MAGFLLATNLQGKVFNLATIKKPTTRGFSKRGTPRFVVSRGAGGIETPRVFATFDTKSRPPSGKGEKKIKFQTNIKISRNQKTIFFFCFH